MTDANRILDSISGYDCLYGCPEFYQRLCILISRSVGGGGRGILQGIITKMCRNNKENHESCHSYRSPIRDCSIAVDVWKWGSCLGLCSHWWCRGVVLSILITLWSCWLVKWSSIPGKGERYFSSPRRPDRLLGPSSLVQWVPGVLSSRYSGRSVKIMTHHLMPRLRVVELYLHSPILFNYVELKTKLIGF
jgi:hypothetical protein